VRTIRNVVCAVDIDDREHRAFVHALAAAAVRDARLLLVCAVPPDEPFSRRATERLTCLWRIRAEAEARGVDVHVSVQTGEAAEIVRLHARDRGADLIVVSTSHGVAQGRRTGAMAAEILRGAECPTLVVREGGHARARFATAVCAMDMPGDSIAAEDALAVLDPREHWLTLLHVVPRNASDTRQADALRRLQERIPEVRRGTVVAQVRRGYVLDEILELTSHTGVDLLVIGARPRASLGRRLFGITRRLLAYEGCPVLAVPAQEVRAARAA
jgi:nucleotide-binding universal stress UspA family protein